MPYVPPVVHSTLVGGPAYLLGWERLDVADGGGWAAKLAWAQVQDEGAWLVKSGVVPAGQVQQIPGQDYSRVPRDPRPRDASDPRDPGHKDSRRAGPPGGSTDR